MCLAEKHTAMSFVLFAKLSGGLGVTAEDSGVRRLRRRGRSLGLTLGLFLSTAGSFFGLALGFHLSLTLSFHLGLALGFFLGRDVSASSAWR